MKLDVIVPTFNNEALLTNMINSMDNIGFFGKGDRRLIIVNNGKQPVDKDYADFIATRNLLVVNCADNRGWEGGLIEGLKLSDAEFVCFQNDDVHIPQNQPNFYDDLMDSCKDDVAMVGPISTTCCGIQSVFHPQTPTSQIDVRWIIGFCVVIKRDVLDEVGGVDEKLPGGDDFDLSIRVRKYGKKIAVIPSAFIIHHGFQTGIRVNGGPDKDGGWNSPQMQERTNKAIIQKHGFREFFTTFQRQVV